MLLYSFYIQYTALPIKKTIFMIIQTLLDCFTQLIEFIEINNFLSLLTELMRGSPQRFIKVSYCGYWTGTYGVIFNNLLYGDEL